jgi:hypothetical protein
VSEYYETASIPRYFFVRVVGKDNLIVSIVHDHVNHDNGYCRSVRGSMMGILLCGETDVADANRRGWKKRQVGGLDRSAMT